VDLAWSDFMNSLQRDWRGGGAAQDQLGRAEWQAAFLTRWGFAAPVPAGEADLAAARRLRALLLDLAGRAAAGGPVEGDGLAALNGFMAGAPVRRRLVAAAGGGYRLEDAGPAGGGWAALLGEVAADFGRTLAEMDPRRIRLCANPDCRWAFYDDTRNGGKRFCEPTTCGNLMRVRRFRARRPY
jgi:predicted RNA-binding Zn ribbon-like protein